LAEPEKPDAVIVGAEPPAALIDMEITTLTDTPELWSVNPIRLLPT
jgi:hypothetical protein